MKRFVLIFALLFFAAHAVAQKVSNVSFVQDGQQVLITYELSDWADIYVEVSTDGGYTYGMIDMRHVSGDVGNDVPPGAIRQITWDVLQDCERLQGELVCFRVAAIEHAVLEVEEDEDYDVINGTDLITMVPEEEAEVDEEKYFVVLERDAEYPRGFDSLYAHLVRNIHYPQLARDNGVSGTVKVKFTIGKNGSIIKACILNDIGGGCGEEVFRAIKSMRCWRPDRYVVRSVNKDFTINITFYLV